MSDSEPEDDDLTRIPLAQRLAASRGRHAGLTTSPKSHPVQRGQKRLSSGSDDHENAESTSRISSWKKGSASSGVRSSPYNDSVRTVLSPITRNCSNNEDSQRSSSTGSNAPQQRHNVIGRKSLSVSPASDSQGTSRSNSSWGGVYPAGGQETSRAPGKSGSATARPARDMWDSDSDGEMGDPSDLPDLTEPDPSLPDLAEPKPSQRHKDIARKAVTPPVQTGATKKRQESRERKDGAAEKKAEMKRRKEEEREEKKRAKEMETKRKRIEKEEQKAYSKENCLKHMVVCIDSRILQHPCGPDILRTLQASQPPVKYSVETQSFPNIITFRRETPRLLETGGKVVQENVETLEDEMLIWLPISHFLQLVNNFIQAESRVEISRDQETLRDFVRAARTRLENRPVTLLVQGLEQHFRLKHGGGKKRTKKADQSRKEPETPEVTRMEVDQVLMDVQIETGCNVRLMESDEEVAKTVFHFTKAVAEKPAKQSRMHLDVGIHIEDKGGCRVDKDGTGLLQLWRTQITQFHNVTGAVADAIVARFPSPWQLAHAYKTCASQTEAERLLEDIQVRRAHGPLETSRRVGKELSRRMYQLFTSTDPEQVL